MRDNGCYVMNDEEIGEALKIIERVKEEHKRQQIVDAAIKKLREAADILERFAEYSRFKPLYPK